MITNKYLILTPRVSSLGGAQLYVSRRATYLYQKGIEVYIVTYDSNDYFKAKDFEKFPILNINELKKYPAILQKKRIKKIVDKIIFFIGGVTENLVVETHIPVLSIWGEIISSSFKCKHFIYFLSEPNIRSNSNRCYCDFFLFKLNRNELIGISDKSLKIIFKDLYKDEKNNYVNVPFDSNEIVEKTQTTIFSGINPKSFIIATVSRLSKSYIEPLINDILVFASQNPHRTICFIVIGDDDNKEILTSLKRKYEKVIRNLEIMFPGYVYPLGKDFFKKIDVFIGMGTSVIMAISQKCVTITIDPISNNASGILGVTNMNFAYPNNEKLYDTKDLLDELINSSIFFEKSQNMGFELYQKEYSYDTVMQKLDSYAFADYQGHWELDKLLCFKCKIYSIFAITTSLVYLFVKNQIKKIKQYFKYR